MSSTISHGEISHDGETTTLKLPRLVENNYQFLKLGLRFLEKSLSRFCPTFRVLKPTAPNHGQSLVVHKKFSSFAAYGGFSICFANSRTFFMSYPVGWGVIAFIAHHPAQTSRRLQNSQVTLHGFQQRQVQDTWSGNGAAKPTVE
jgi:hypothetical protein